MTASPGTPPRRPVGQALALMLLPTAVALALLVLGLTATNSLVLIYLSIAVSLIALPAFVLGVVMLVRK